jgi:site-specific DNA-methyltransferase (adenine-specific)
MYVVGQHEYVFHLTHYGDVELAREADGVGVPFADKSNLDRGNRGKHGDRRDRGNTWFIPYQTIKRRATDRPHPATFPVELAERCLRIHGVDRIQRVLDPFMGIGSTARACVRLGLPCLGFELDPYYHQESLRLVKEEEERLHATHHCHATDRADGLLCGAGV